MKALVILRTLLLADAGVTAKRTGGVHTNAAPQEDAMPNVVLLLVSGLEDFTHSGPSGLVEDRVRVWCRGKTAREAGELGAAVHAALQGYVGEVGDAYVQLCRVAMSTSDYQDSANVHRSIIDFNVSWNLA
ncbi:MAG: DUF3168 domain-containing protein [Hoeflea sp.]|uniref:DUF3168 domain-containing protein n=1 Tax=Hoeflea sp. TaxID=1940281 RepID=UPI001DB90A9D|nr:DUF3168 domain-containing protein [Hoeflea sp.]MBU4529777.1 DUF3168 domain-containing protein [Alphaproteobacteria bacterium]MBU4543338.1 DUF3168 domain-containing protein [Alphaproteobacteria bacterium]MBU4552525.1 DUF3168 domain-containing protein [Alphaproteobacteria bacterium]MBV1723541.1 DUF3168 domain-containing protein [Hoeflea sp.]MBV1762990.1 DUF3168 domain-containing protein [Hoeflea sp.]